MESNQDEELLMEIKDIIEGNYFSYALELFSQLKDKNSEKSLMLKKEIYEGFFKEAKKMMDYKLNELLKEYVKKKNFRLLKLELDILRKNLEFLKSIIFQLDPNEKVDRKFRLDVNPWKKLHNEYAQYESAVLKSLNDYQKTYEKLIEETKKNLEKKQKERRLGKRIRKIIKVRKEKKAEEEIKEIEENGPKVELLLEMEKGNNENNSVEYLPFLGVTSVRLRILVNQPIQKLIIRPKITTNFYSENIEWSNYICGMDNENIDHDLKKGFMALFGGGKPAGFIMFNPPAESYTFFFLRHQDRKIQENIDYSITFEAIEEISENEEILLSSITVQLKYPEAIRPKEPKEIPDFNDPLCPVHAIYKYDYSKRIVRKEKYREITFKGNVIPDYYQRWWPPQKIQYHPISNPEKISNLVVRSYPYGFARIFYNFNGELHEIGELRGRLSPAVFHDPLGMTTAEIFQFFSDDLIVLRIWFWWIDYRINDKLVRIKHEMPDFERVDFLIDLRNPSKDIQMVPFIATDVHWKEFWLDTRDIKGKIQVRFTPIGVDLINWKQLVAFFTHHEGIMYKPLPVIIHELFSWVKDPNTFYCVSCGNRTILPSNIPAMREMIEDLNEEAIREVNRRIIEEMSDLICPSCQKLFAKEEKLQYIFLFEDYSKFKKKLKEDVLDSALEMQEEEEEEAEAEKGGQPLSMKRQNCHVPTPMDGITSNEWCSSTVIEPLSLKRITLVKEYEEGLNKIDVINVADLEGLNQKIVIQLAKIGIIKLKDLINTRVEDILSRLDLTVFDEKEKKFFESNLQRWQEMAKLYQIKGIGRQYSDLLVFLGVNLDSLRSFSGDPMELIDKIETYNTINNEMGPVPTLEEVESWIEQAKALKI